jgi:hypothetical protein
VKSLTSGICSTTLSIMCSRKEGLAIHTLAWLGTAGHTIGTLPYIILSDLTKNSRLDGAVITLGSRALVEGRTTLTLAVPILDVVSASPISNTQHLKPCSIRVLIAKALQNLGSTQKQCTSVDDALFEPCQ